ncbi:DoxX family protein [uncultured Ramlibacter sp.]|uniref:DoxX family protein n=1 Tax=uncultured Ramlibacter sp. TaxID=260755 RepID=UPI002612F69D|nr:DoxX family protein [uncultured Ramlibacter sp.]
MSWAQRIGVGLSALATLFFLMDAVGKLLRIEPVLKASVELGWPAASAVPLGMLLMAGALLYALPRTSFIGAVWLTAYLGGAIASQYRIGAPLVSHVLFGVYVALVMWGGLALRYPAVFRAALANPQ